MTTTSNQDDVVSCQCSEWSGNPCVWRGPLHSTVEVEYMPHWIRGSHGAAGNRGTYPNNGAVRIRVSAQCADTMTEHDPDWCSKL